MSSPAAITLDRVTKVYDKPVVSDISLEVPEEASSRCWDLPALARARYCK